MSFGGISTMGNMSRNLSDFRMLCLYLVSHLRKKAVMDKVEDPERCAPLDNKLYTVLRASRVHFSVYISTIIIVITARTSCKLMYRTLNFCAATDKRTMTIPCYLRWPTEQ